MNPSDCHEPYPERVAAEVIEGEAVIINLETGVYYSLDGAAGTLWQMVGERLDVRSMVDALVDAYEVEASDAERDVRRVLEQLVEEGLVRRAAGTTERRARPAPPVRAPYVTPEVQAYRDMQDLLALDPPSPGLNGVVWKRTSESA